MILSWTFYNFLGCFTHLQAGQAGYPRLTVTEALLNVTIGAWALNQILQG